MTEDFDNENGTEDGTEDGADNTSAPSWQTETSAYDAVLDPTHRIRFITTQGTFDAPVTDGQPMTLAQALTVANLRYNAASIFELDGAQITLETVLQPGAQVVAISATKGG